MIVEACVLLALATSVLGQEDSIVGCSETEYDVTGLKDTLRQSACRLGPGGNMTAAAAFRQYVRTKHGFPNDRRFFYTFTPLFRLETSPVWCRTTCPSPAPENITWCVNIAYLGRDVEMCVRLGPNQTMITNSTCEAELVEVASYLSLPTDCSGYGDVGCLGLTNLDWFFEAAYFTCTVHTDTCYSKSFTELLVTSGVSRTPEFEVFPTSPFEVLSTDSMVLHAEVSTTTERITVSWQHGDVIHNDFIFEDPFCDQDIEECINDTHPETEMLRHERIRAYRTTRYIRLNGCLTSFIYRLESYLIIDNVTEQDGGEYVFNLTSTHSGFSPITVTRSVNTSINCHHEPEDATCSTDSLTLIKGTNTQWHCQLTNVPATNFSLIINKTIVIPPSKPEMTCGKEPLIIFTVEEDPVHLCYSSYNVSVIICSADKNIVGEFYLASSNGVFALGTNIDVKLLKDPYTKVDSPSDKNDVSSTVVYAAPLATLVGSLLMTSVVLLVVLRARKRRRVVRIQSPTLKEATFFKEEIDQGLICPASPGNSSLGDPLEFPRNRLYIYSHKVLGEGSFGRVLQAKAEGIVPGMPDRNVVAIKTTKENATSVEREELLAELQLMRTMEPHENILNLLGQCTMGGGPVCLIVEFASYGNLRDFLRQCEEVVLSLNHLPHIPRNRSRTRTLSTSSCGSSQPLIARQDSVFTPSSGHTHFVFPSPTGHVSSGSSSSADMKLTAHHPDATAVPLAHAVAPIGHDYINTKGLVYMEDVHNFALQIACGLQHLASMQIVHCDLAARNVLIAEGFVLKIADFGLARDISGREMYKKNPRGKIPVKWTAPEALENRVFTVKSDVWSYGVLLWELFTYGHTPYPDVNLGSSYEAFVSYLKAGNRMQQPESSPASFYELMLECWHLDPNLRPSPHDIVVQLTPTDSTFDDADSELNAGQQVNSSATSGGQQSSQE